MAETGLARLFGSPTGPRRFGAAAAPRAFGPAAAVTPVSTPIGLERLLTPAPSGLGRINDTPGTIDPGQTQIAPRPAASRTFRPATPVQAPDPGSIGGGDAGGGSVAGGSMADVSPADVAGFRGPTVGLGERGLGFSLTGPNNLGIGRGATLSANPTGLVSLGTSGLSGGAKGLTGLAGLVASLFGLPSSTNVLNMVSPLAATMTGPAGLAMGGFQGLVGLAGKIASALGIPTTNALAQMQSGINDPDPNEAEAALSGIAGLADAVAAASPGSAVGLTGHQASLAAQGMLAGIGISPDSVHSDPEGLGGVPGGYVSMRPTQHQLNFALRGAPEETPAPPAVPGVGVSAPGLDPSDTAGMGATPAGNAAAAAAAAAGANAATASEAAAAADAAAAAAAANAGDAGSGSAGGNTSDAGSDSGGVGGVWHRGGPVTDARPGRQEVSGRLLEGEHVIDVDSSERYGPALEAINENRVPRGLDRLLVSMGKEKLPGRDVLSAIQRRRAGLPDGGRLGRPEFAKDAGPTGDGSGFRRAKQAPRGLERLLRSDQ